MNILTFDEITSKYSELKDIRFVLAEIGMQSAHTRLSISYVDGHVSGKRIDYILADGKYGRLIILGRDDCRVNVINDGRMPDAYVVILGDGTAMFRKPSSKSFSKGSVSLREAYKKRSVSSSILIIEAWLKIFALSGSNGAMKKNKAQKLSSLIYQYAKASGFTGTQASFGYSYPLARKIMEDTGLIKFSNNTVSTDFSGRIPEAMAKAVKYIRKEKPASTYITFSIQFSYGSASNIVRFDDGSLGVKNTDGPSIREMLEFSCGESVIKKTASLPAATPIGTTVAPPLHVEEPESFIQKAIGKVTDTVADALDTVSDAIDDVRSKIVKLDIIDMSIEQIYETINNKDKYIYATEGKMASVIIHSVQIDITPEGVVITLCDTNGDIFSGSELYANKDEAFKAFLGE